MAGTKSHRLLLVFLLAVCLFCSFLLTRALRPGLSSIQGHVLDNGDPVIGARVRIKGQASSGLTDDNGRFQIPWDPPVGDNIGGIRLTACKKGYLIAGTALSSAPLTFNLRRLPATDYEDYQWVDPVPNRSRPQNCGNCHGEIYQEWSASGHAHAGNNRRFLNLLDGSDWEGRPHVSWSLRDDHPDAVGVCNACHAPTASFDADLSQMRGVARQGVHCDFCHKIADVSKANLGFTHGRYGYQLLRPSQGQLFFGPLDDVDRDEDVFSPLYQQSLYCAACHEGTVFGVPVYTTYSEWLVSPARKEGKQCQSCHMAPTGKLTNIAPGKGGIDRDPQTLVNHWFFAGSQAEMLRRSLQVDATITPGKAGLEAVIEIRADEIGHRVPTGFVDRNLLLVIEPLGKEGQKVRINEGPTLPVHAGKEWAGLPGKLYAKRLVDSEGHSPVPFWRASPEMEDNRLFPGQTDRLTFRFSEADQLRVRLLYRHFWPEVFQTKGWPDDSIPLVDQNLSLDTRRVTHWSSH